MVNKQYQEPKRTLQAHLSEIVQDIPLSLIRKHHIRRDRHNQTAHQTNPRRNMGDPRKSIQRRRPQTPINQQRIVMTHKRKADHPNRLKDLRFNQREPF